MTDSLSTPALLDTLQQMVSDVNEVNGTNDKIERMKKYPQLREFLKLLYDPNSTTGIKSEQLEKFAQKKKPATKKAKVQKATETNLMTLVEKLYRRDYSGNEAKEVVLDFIDQYPQHKDLIYKIIDKDLETRLDIKQLNKVFPNFIVEFSVALAQDFAKGESYFKKNTKAGWLISRKLDGIRCIVLVSKGKAQAFSRNGNRLPALAPLEELIQSHCTSADSFALDGEVCSMDDDGTENFTEAVSQAKRKSVRMEQFRYYVFDKLLEEEFTSGESQRILTDRLQDAERFVTKVNKPDNLRLVVHIPYTPDEFERQQQLVSDHNWEGLMLRYNTTYKGKRSNDILKVKKFFTEEYVVQDYEVGPMRIIDKDTGLETTIETLKSVVIDHKGNQVNVGSGFTIPERQKYYDNPKLIVGKTISVRYFEEISSENGTKFSLRFPTFVALHGKTRNL